MQAKQLKNFTTQVKDVDSKGRVLVAANAIGNVDSDQDMSLDGSFNKTLGENFNRVRWFLNHDKTILLGVPVEGKQDGSYLSMLGQLNMKKQISIDTYEDYKLYAEYGKSLEHSIGVSAVKWMQEGDIRKVSEWKLWEYSTLTSWGANPDTPMQAIKSESDAKEAVDWLTIMLKKGNYTDLKFKQIEQQLQVLKTLVTEPSNDTLIIEPSNEVIVSTIKQFTNNLNIK